MAAIGRALQLTNILRDLDEDAEHNRLYLPRELLEAHGVAITEPRFVLSRPAIVRRSTPAPRQPPRAYKGPASETLV
jgi:hypothetical protein